MDKNDSASASALSASLGSLLPAEVWLHVFSWVGGVEVARTAGLVCREWYQLAQDELCLWKPLCQREMGVHASPPPDVSWKQWYISHRTRVLRFYVGGEVMATILAGLECTDNEARHKSFRDHFSKLPNQAYQLLPFACSSSSSPRYGASFLWSPPPSRSFRQCFRGMTTTNAALFMTPVAPTTVSSLHRPRSDIRECTRLARLHKVKVVVLAVLFTDCCDEGGSRFERTSTDMRKYFSTMTGMFSAAEVAERVILVPVCSSKHNGKNTKKKEEGEEMLSNVWERDERMDAWYRGPTLMEAIANIQLPVSAIPAVMKLPQRPLRATILRSWKLQQRHEGERRATIYGHCLQGQLTTGQRLTISPWGLKVTVLSLATATATPAQHVAPRDLIRPNDLFTAALKVEDESWSRDLHSLVGGVLGLNESTGDNNNRNNRRNKNKQKEESKDKEEVEVMPRPVASFEAQLYLESGPLSAGIKLTFFVGTAVVSCQCSEISYRKAVHVGSRINTSRPQSEDRPRLAYGGDLVTATFTPVDRALCLEKFATCPALGRFLVKNGMNVSGVGKITDITWAEESKEGGFDASKYGSHRKPRAKELSLNNLEVTVYSATIFSHCPWTYVVFLVFFFCSSSSFSFSLLLKQSSYA
ncbi:hypothetical protein QOT17_003041 [Balamuthia mandrillaris]